MFLNPWYGGAQGGGPGTLGVGPPSLEGVVTHEEALDSLEAAEDFVQQQSYIGRASPLPLQQPTQGRASPALSYHSDAALQGRASPLLGRGSPLSRSASPVVRQGSRQGSPVGLIRVGSGGSGSGGRNSPAILHPVAGVVAVTSSVLERINGRLRESWTAHATPQGRLYYCNHGSGTSSWLPPLENWDSGGLALPYGWEASRDKDNKQYFINHLNKTTTYEDPRKDFQEEPPQEREYELTRDTEMGFGFVAGSEKPVIVRFVTEGGPSAELLMPGDQILTINGEDVKAAPRDHVIALVRKCKDKVTLTVTQPPLDNSARKSALLSAAKKQRLKSNPSRVRFAESVDINNESPSSSPSNFNSSESTTPFMPNVLKVFLENGQTKSFKYDSSTTVGDVLENLHIKLGIKCPEHFSLVVEHVKSLRRNKLTILDPKEALSMIAARPGAQHLRCLYRVTFVPRDAYILLRKDSMAFEYLFLQVNNHPVWYRTQFTSHQRRTTTPLRYTTIYPLDVGSTRCSKLKSYNGMINVANDIQEFGVYLSRSPFEKIGRKQNLFPSYSSSTSSISSKVFCMLSWPLTHCASYIVSAYASGVSYVSSGLVNVLLSHDTQKPACLFKWSIALLCFLPTHICMVRSASSSLIYTSAVPKKQICLQSYHMSFSEILHTKDFSTSAALNQKDHESNPIKDKLDKLKSSADSLKKWTPSKETFENMKPLSKVVKDSKFLSDSINRVGKIDMKNLKSTLNKFSGIKLSPEKKEEIKSFWEDMKKGNVQKSFSNISLRNDMKSVSLKNWKSITDVGKWKYYWKNWKTEKEIPKITSKEFFPDNVNSRSFHDNKNKVISPENGDKLKTTDNNHEISKSVNKVDGIALKDSLDQKIKSNSLFENANKIIPNESIDKLKTYLQKKELMDDKSITSNKSLKERFRPSLAKVGKGVWTHRKYLYWLYHFSFILSIYRSVKKGIKWAIGLTLGTVLYRNSNLIANKFDKFKSFGLFLVNRSFVKKIALLTKKLFRFNFFINLFKRIFKKK